ncbi:hypothetical protein L0128_04835 [candidate division KSB1 bacterium]|nr:hypothetical protein [candidate division KSB1 bacterium]
MTKVIQAVLLTFYIGAAPIRAEIAIGSNHPELAWKYRETPHFKIIYHTGTETLAAEAARVAEAVYAPITSDLGVQSTPRFSLIISDYDDISNGMAYVPGHYIFIWSQNFTKYTTGPMPWLRRVMAHELTHQICFWSQRNFLGTPWELFALGTTPTWFSEGVAQYEAERWDTHRDLLLRVAVQDQALLPRKKLEGFLGGDQIDARLVYEQGHSLVRYIAAKYGADKMALILKKQRQRPISFNWALQRALGISESQLIRDWQQQIQPHYAAQCVGTEKLARRYPRFQKQLPAIYGLRWSPDGQYAAVVGLESLKENVTRLYLFNAQGKKLKVLAGPEIGSHFAWSPDGTRVVYTQLRIGRHASRIHDLYLVQVSNGQKERLTDNLRATDPDWAPSGKELVFCQHLGPYSNLVRYDLERKTFTPITHFSDWNEVFTPRWKPDGSWIAFSWLNPLGARDIAAIRPDGTEFTPLTQDSSDDRTPDWSPDGQKIAFISDRSGSPNLCWLDPLRRYVTPITNSPGGVFHPAWTSNGQAISVIAFEARHTIQAYTITLDAPAAVSDSLTPAPMQGIPWHQTLPPNAAPVQLNPDLRTASIFADASEKKYTAVTHIRPWLTLPWMDSGAAGWQFGLLNYAGDPLEKHLLLTTITQRQRTNYALQYTNRQWLPFVRLNLSQFSYDRGSFYGQTLWDNLVAAQLQFQFPINFGNNLLARHYFWIEAEISRTTQTTPAKLNPYPAGTQPFSGWMNTIAVGYSYINARPSTTTDIHPNTGLILSGQWRRSDAWLGSDLQFTQLSTYLALRQAALFSNHLWAWRLGNFTHAGSQRIQARHALGTTLLRGLENTIEGTRMVYTNLEYRFPILEDCGLKLWFLYWEGIFAAGFVDLGWVWGDYLAYSRKNQTYIWLNHSFKQSNWLGTWGLELRGRFFLAGKIGFVVRGGIAQRCDESKARPQTFILIGPVF